jgi:hypothetical protein
VNVPTHTIVSDAISTTTLSYVRIVGIKCQQSLRLKQGLHKQKKTSSAPTEPKQGSYCSFKEQRTSRVLLATATIKVTDFRGIQQPCRVLPDGGSQSSYITEAFAQLLLLKRRRNEMPITGINNTCSAATHSMDIKFSSKDSKYCNVVTCLSYLI